MNMHSIAKHLHLRTRASLHTIPQTGTAIPCAAATLLLFALSAAPASAAPATPPNPPAPVPLPAAAQDSAAGFGRLDPTPPTGIAPEEIVKRLGAREAEFQRLRDEYIFTQSVKIQTISEDTGKPDGEYQQVTNITFNDDGKRLEKVLFAPANSIQRVILTENDFDEIEHRLPFVLTTAELPKYNVTYLGRQKVDDLDTYVFEAGPKTFEKKQHYFQGKVWVDQQDFQIVLINGITVPQDTRPGHEDLSPPFTTYYEQVDGKYWFPTYTHAEGILHFKAQNGALSEDIHIKSIVKYTDYKRFRAKSRILFGDQDITATTPPK